MAGQENSTQPLAKGWVKAQTLKHKSENSTDFSFKVLKKSKKSNARLGLLKTPHGIVETPSFVAVGTKGTVKSLSPDDLEAVGTQIVFVNTYHTVLSPGAGVIEKSGGIHKYSGIEKPIITDSGGFQVFSLGYRVTQKGKKRNSTQNYHRPPVKVKITNDGAEFRSPIDGKKFFFTPEFSIEAQRKIGADFVIHFDECIYHKAPRNYAEKATERSDKWAKVSLDAFKKKQVNQQIFGVVQGGMYEDLRTKSAHHISSLPFFGLAIGGVSVGETKREMRKQISWVMNVVEKDTRPKHLLGVGQIDDIFDTIPMGIDMMDCVVPTRHARMGKLLVNFQFPISNFQSIFNSQNKKKWQIDILKSEYRADLRPVDQRCNCYTCRKFTRSYIHHLFKQKELLAYRLATIHNLFFMEKLFGTIREMIKKDKI